MTKVVTLEKWTKARNKNIQQRIKTKARKASERKAAPSQEDLKKARTTLSKVITGLQVSSTEMALVYRLPEEELKSLTEFK